MNTPIRRPVQVFRLVRWLGLSVLLATTALPGSVRAEGGVKLPWGLHLNGRFDLNYERRDFRANPFDSAGTDNFANYHHYLFLSRGKQRDPFFFTAEILTLKFYEIGYKLAPIDAHWSLRVKAGKLVVPFGPEPTFHHSYGGLSGFDQELLPAIWAVPGLTAQGQLQAGPVRLTLDAYMVQGYALNSEDSVLDLTGQPAFGVESPFEFRPAFGGRLGVGWGPLAVWYSAYVNKLGFGRMLFLEAVDVGVWRIPGIPVLEDLSLSFGAMRADVSGGGAGKDYYHFGDYVDLRYYPLDWLTLRYRAGLKTFDNRRGLYYDSRRADSLDTSAHSVGVIASYRGLSVGVYYYLRFEKKDEIDNDFLRVQAVYEF